jgi:hypothetical protein
MNITMIRGQKMAYMGPLLGGGLLLAGTALLLPNRGQIADAIRRATFVAPAPAAVLPPATTAELMQRFTQGKPLTEPDLRHLLAASTSTASGPLLSRMANQLERSGGQAATDRITYDILASGRSDAALAFLDGRPDGRSSPLWRLRFELYRKLGDDQGAIDLLRAAVVTKGSAPSRDIAEAAYALARPDMLITAAEHGIVPPLTRTQSLDLASWANGEKRYELIGRIDRAGTRAWRGDNPWLAMTLAQRAGDTASALRYAALLPSGSDAARESILIASGDRGAMRRLLLERAATGREDRAAVAQQLLEKGFRPDAIALLRQQSAGRATGDPAANRMLYLMGPRPSAQDLAWLRARAVGDPRWIPAYLDREQPARALAFLEGRSNATDTAILLDRIRFASAAHDEDAARRALDLLLDGRSLDAPAIKSAASAPMSAAMASRYAPRLAQARIRAGQARPDDHMTIAWSAWDRGDAAGAAEQLSAYLRDRPDDRAALRLMATAKAKLGGPSSEKPWLARLLPLTPAISRERAELLAKLGRTSEAIALFEALRQQSPGDRQLDIQYARLLIAAGDPGKARKVLRP